MFTDEELDGAPSDQFVEWIDKTEVDVDEAILAICSYRYHDMYIDARKEMVEMLIACWNAKKCPYA